MEEEDVILYLLASYERLFGGGHCTASMVKTRNARKQQPASPRVSFACRREQRLSSAREEEH